MAVKLPKLNIADERADTGLTALESTPMAKLEKSEKRSICLSPKVISTEPNDLDVSAITHRYSVKKPFFTARNSPERAMNL